MQHPNGNNLARVKVANQAAIREIIYDYGPISRGEISERLALTLPTITTTINALLAKGIIREVAGEAVKKSMGRRASQIDVAGDARLFLGMEIRGAGRQVCLADYRGRVLGALADETPQTDYAAALASALELTHRLLAARALTPDQIAGIGICTPGLVDSERGVLRLYPSCGWQDRPLCADVAEGLAYGGPVVLDNNVYARACGMRLFQREQLKEVQNFAYLYVAQGIACPFVQNNGGAHLSYFGAGEVGHMVLNPAGPLCGCGNRGCLEAFSSERAIVDRCREALARNEAPALRRLCADPLSPALAEILAAQALGDPQVTQILDTAILYLAIAIANLYHFVSPQRVVIDSALFASEENRSKLLEQVHANLRTVSAADAQFTFVSHDEGAGALGAAALAVQRDLQTYVEAD